MWLVCLWLIYLKNETINRRINLKNNNIEITGNICGDVRLLREANADINLKEKIEVIIIANDSYDKEGRPNSLRIYMYGSLAEDFRTHCFNGDRVTVTGHLKRKTIKVRDCNGQPTGEIRYATEIIGESYEIVRQGSTGYFQKLKRENSSSQSEVLLSDETAGVDYSQVDNGDNQNPTVIAVSSNTID